MKVTTQGRAGAVGIAAAGSLVLAGLLAAPASAVPACSPVVTSLPGETVLSFTTTGTCGWEVPAGVTALTQVLIVGGGGGGGHDIAGGGGAGGVIQLSNVSVTPGSVVLLTVGAGGVGNTGYATNPASNGEDSVFLSNTAKGGGAGGSGGETGKNGGSGGGGGYGANGLSPAGGTSTQTAPGVGFGGGASTVNYLSGGGGGGAGGAGQAAGTGGNTDQGGNGGAGIASSITGTLRYYAGGGGGGSQPGGTGTTGGSGVGGNGGRVAQGSTPEITVGAGAANTGSGGGGAGSGNNPAVKDGGDGGSGVVIVRFAGSYGPSAATDEVTPPDWFQSRVRTGSLDACDAGWSPSWAEWPNGGTGGWVCNRVLFWDRSSGSWGSRA